MRLPCKKHSLVALHLYVEPGSTVSHSSFKPLAAQTCASPTSSSQKWLKLRLFWVAAWSFLQTAVSRSRVTITGASFLLSMPVLALISLKTIKTGLQYGFRNCHGAWLAVQVANFNRVDCISWKSRQSGEGTVAVNALSVKRPLSECFCFQWTF